MNMRVTLTETILLAGIVSSIAHSAVAETVPIGRNTPGNVKQFCNANGGTFFTGAKGWGYGCMLNNGNCIVCGGITAQQKSTCERTRLRPSDFRRIRPILGRVAKLAGHL